MRWALGDRLAPVKVVLELRRLGFLVENDLRFQNAFVEINLAQRGAGLGGIIDALGHDIPRPSQRGCSIGHFFFNRNKRRRFSLGVCLSALLPEQIGKRLESAFLGNGGTSAFLRTEGKIKILEGGEIRCGVDFDFQLLGEELALFEGAENRLAALVEFLKLLHAVTDVGDLNFIKLTGALLAVAGNEGNRGALLEKNGGGCDLTGLQG